MKSIKISAAAAAIAIAAAAAGTAGAQDHPQYQEGQWAGAWDPRGMMGYGGMGPWMRGLGSSGEAMCAKVRHIEGRLAYIKAELKITEAQQLLWNSYAAAARDNTSVMLKHCTAMINQRLASPATLPDLLDQHEQLMAVRLDTVRAMIKALKPLYAALSDSQKQMADQLFWGPIGMM